MKSSNKNLLQRFLLFIFIGCMLTISTNENVAAQNDSPYVRIAKIVVVAAQLENYKAALKEGTAIAVRDEPGVISLYAVYDENDPTHITVFEIYANKAAYELHIQTPHFKKYKTTVEKMVESLELTDVVPIAFEAKQK